MVPPPQINRKYDVSDFWNVLWALRTFLCDGAMISGGTEKEGQSVSAPETWVHMVSDRYGVLEVRERNEAEGSQVR